MTEDEKITEIEKLTCEISSVLFDEKVWIGEKMWKIAEVTYSYTDIDDNGVPLTLNGKNIMINYTLFCEIGGLELKRFQKYSNERKKREILRASKQLENKINIKIYQTEEYLRRIEEFLIQTKTLEEIYTLEILYDSLEEKLNFFYYCYLGINYELEKAGIFIDFDKKQTDKHLRQLDEILFGGQVHKSPLEVDLCYNQLVQNYLENIGKLNEKERITYESYLHKVENHISPQYKYHEKKYPPSLLSSYQKYKIKDSKYIPGFNFFIESLEGLEHIALQNDEAGSISDGPSIIEFPNNSHFKTLDLKRILKLNAHEIETHSITDHNHKRIFGNIRGAKSIEKDEGLAIFMENILEYGSGLYKKDTKTGKLTFDIFKFKLGNNLSYTLMGELLTNEDLLNFLEIYAKLSDIKTSPIDRYYRLKRSNGKGVQHKDTSYTRGLIRTVKEINKYIISDGKDGIKPEKLFLGKIGFDDIEKLNYIKNKKRNRGHHLGLIMPIFASDAVIYSINKKKNGAKLVEENFLKYLEKKYPFFEFKEKRIRIIAKKINHNIKSIVDILTSDMEGKDENFVFLLENAVRKLSDKRKEVAEKYIGIES